MLWIRFPGVAISGQHPLHDIGRGRTWHKWKGDHSPTPALDLMLADDIVAQIARSPKNFNMARMQDVKASISENDIFTRSLQLVNPPCDLLDGRNHTTMIASRRAPVFGQNQRRTRI
jgi:hypothetical protein